MECVKIINEEGFLVDTCTGEVVDDYRYTYERYDNLVPITVTKIDTTDEEKFRQYMKIANRKDHETEMVKNSLLNRIENEKVRKDFLRLAEESKKYGKAGIIASFVLAHYLNGISVRAKDLRREFGVGDFEFREVRKLLQLKIGKKDIDNLVLQKLKELKGYDFEELKKRYFQLLAEGKLSGKNVKTRIEMVLGNIKRSYRKKERKENVVEVLENGRVICPKCGLPGHVEMEEIKGHTYYYVRHYLGNYKRVKHYLGKVRLVKKVVLSD